MHFTAYDLVAKAIKPIIDAFQHLYNLTDQTEPSAGSLQLSTLAR